MNNEYDEWMMINNNGMNNIMNDDRWLKWIMNDRWWWMEWNRMEWMNDRMIEWMNEWMDWSNDRMNGIE